MTSQYCSQELVVRAIRPSSVQVSKCDSLTMSLPSQLDSLNKLLCYQFKLSDEFFEHTGPALILTNLRLGICKEDVELLRTDRALQIEPSRWPSVEVDSISCRYCTRTSLTLTHHKHFSQPFE